jgi:hypothetical protein
VVLPVLHPHSIRDDERYDPEQAMLAAIGAGQSRKAVR